MLSKQVLPKDIYDAYPGSDLLDIDPPNVNEDFDEYFERVGKDAIRRCGDTLFAFLIFELASAENDPLQSVNLLNTALRDVLSVQQAIARKM